MAQPPGREHSPAGGGRERGSAPPPLAPAPSRTPPTPSPDASPQRHAPAAASVGAPPADVAAALQGALAGIVDKPSLYLVRAAQATTLRQLKAARKQLRDFNTGARAQLEGQFAALEAGAAALGSIRADLDAVNAFLRERKAALLAAHPELAERLAGGGGDEEG